MSKNTCIRLLLSRLRKQLRQKIAPEQIAILGWGSLIWDHQSNKKGNFDGSRTKWKPDGPMIPIEFCRQSTSRGDALTLVIEEVYGEQCKVQWCLSTQHALKDARQNLCDREECTSLTPIHYISVKVKPPTESKTNATIRAWAEKKGIDHVIWTGLKRNFPLVGNQVGPFSVPNAVTYLYGLPDDGKKLAVQYIRKAPPYVITPLRTQLQKENWFTSFVLPEDMR